MHAYACPRFVTLASSQYLTHQRSFPRRPSRMFTLPRLSPVAPGKTLPGQLQTRRPPIHGPQDRHHPPQRLPRTGLRPSRPQRPPPPHFPRPRRPHQRQHGLRSLLPGPAVPRGPRRTDRTRGPPPPPKIPLHQADHLLHLLAGVRDRAAPGERGRRSVRRLDERARRRAPDQRAGVRRDADLRRGPPLRVFVPGVYARGVERRRGGVGAFREPSAGPLRAVGVVHFGDAGRDQRGEHLSHAERQPGVGTEQRILERVDPASKFAGILVGKWAARVRGRVRSDIFAGRERSSRHTGEKGVKSFCSDITNSIYFYNLKIIKTDPFPGVRKVDL
mmetsp:Transcript_6048/g.13010  ORF Transcript_6048/g.13010 Transcript_6048/m.13010 type:complete len:332 (+) Transcript_6048:761-1756(+)